MLQPSPQPMLQVNERKQNLDELTYHDSRPPVFRPNRNNGGIPVKILMVLNDAL